MTNNQFIGLALEDLIERSYGDGEIVDVKVLEECDDFTRKMINYPSDGLTINGFVNVPKDEGPFPVVVVLHGYVDPHLWHTLCYTTHYADALTEAGFFVLHPNYRNHPPSDQGPNLFRVGYAVDVLNLLALIRKLGGKPGPLQKADPKRIGLVGHSMGGGITHRVITIDTAVKAAVLYAGLTGDDRRNFGRILEWTAGLRGREEFEASEETLSRIAPMYYMDRIRTALSIHYGDEDICTPSEWAVELKDALTARGKEAECFIYSGQGHYLQGGSDQLFIERMVRFFNKHLIMAS